MSTNRRRLHDDYVPHDSLAADPEIYDNDSAEDDIVEVVSSEDPLEDAMAEVLAGDDVSAFMEDFEPLNSPSRYQSANGFYGSIARNCSVCGESFQVQQDQTCKVRVYCSPTCRAAYKQQNARGDRIASVLLMIGLALVPILIILGGWGLYNLALEWAGPIGASETNRAYERAREDENRKQNREIRRQIETFVDVQERRRDEKRFK